MNRNVFIIIYGLFVGILSAGAADYYVSTSGNDTNPGTLALPFATIQKAADTMSAGDTCYLRGGTYRDQITMNALNGSTINPFRFENYNGEEVLIDGTMEISTSWTVHSGNIYKTTISQDIWQLFVNNGMAQPARWPNSYNVTRPDYGGKDGAEPGSFWDMDGTRPRQAPGSSYGVLVNDPAFYDLAAENKDFTGAMMVGFRMIVSGNDVFYEEVTDHSAGTNTFSFTDQTYSTNASGNIPLDQGRYYLTAHLNCLDQPGEWFYDKDTGELYLWAEDGSNPSTKNISGRTNDFVLQINNSSHITFKGIRLFATAFKTGGSDHIEFDACRFSFPSCAKLMLKSVLEAETNEFGGSDVDPSGNTLHNCELEYAEGRTIQIRSKGNLIENCYAHHAAWGRTTFGVMSDKKGERTTYRRCTFSTWGKGNAIKCGPSVQIEYCHAFNAYYHGDNSGFQIPSGSQEGSVLHHNWIHDCVKRNGVRFDGDPAGIRGTIYRTVSLRNGKGFRLKGDQHKIMNIIGVNNASSADVNIAFDKFYGYDPPGSMEYTNRVDGRRGDYPYAGNLNSIAANIAGDLITPDPLSPAVQSGIWEGFDHSTFLRNELRDPDNFDFRPRAGSVLIDAGTNIAELAEATAGYVGAAPDIGAYEFGATHYWIPGYQTAAARNPVPPDEAYAIKADAELMWLEGLDSVSHKVYFGTNETSLVFQTNQTANIFDPGLLVEGRTNYWRIDEVTPAGIVTGTVWSCAANPATAPVSYFPTDDSYTSSSTTTPHGGDANLIIKNSSTGYIQFDLNSLNSGVASATLRVATGADAGQLPVSPSFYIVSDNDWDESTLVGATMPAAGALITNLSSTTFAASTYYEIDVTSVVSNSGAGLYSFAIKDSGVTSGKSRWSSKEGEYDPELVVVPNNDGAANYPPYYTANTFNLSDAYEANFYTNTIADRASDPEGDVLTYSKAGGPVWLSIASNGDVSGMPSILNLGPNVFMVKVMDGNDAYGFADITIDVILTSSNQAPVFTSNPVNEAFALENVAYSATLADNAVDLDGDPMHFSKVFGPAWLIVTDDGSLTGTPEPADLGTNNFVVTVTDLLDGTNSASLNILVKTLLSTDLLYPLADAYVDSLSSNINFGGSAGLELRSTTDPGKSVQHGYIKFQIPNGDPISKATLRLHRGGSKAMTGGISIHSVSDNSWIEKNDVNAITWNNRPAINATVVASGFGEVGWNEFDVTDAAVNNSVVTWGLIRGGTANSQRPLDTRESSFPPELVIYRANTTSAYVLWTVGYGLIGTNANMTANSDGDPLNNLYEYGLGGVPTNGNDIGILPVYGSEGSSFQYIYRRRRDAAARGLSYALELTDNLVSNNWSSSGYAETGTNAIDTDFEAVTNSIPTVAKPSQFIRLNINLSE